MEQVIKGGLFCVPHKPESDRLINDRRPLNIRERRLNWCELPSGVMLSQLVLEEHQIIRASGYDLSNYFCFIKHLDEWLPRNCFGRSIRGKFLKGFNLDPDTYYPASFQSGLHGGHKRGGHCQATHEGILRAAGCLNPEHTLVYGRLFPQLQILWKGFTQR